MEDTKAFAPMYSPSGGTGTGGLLTSVTVAASTTHAASTQFPGNLDQNGFLQIQIANTSSGWAYVNFGKWGAVTASTVATGYPVAPGAVVVVTVSSEVSGADVILGTGSGNVVFTRGGGL